MAPTVRRVEVTDALRKELRLGPAKANSTPATTNTTTSTSTKACTKATTTAVSKATTTTSKRPATKKKVVPLTPLAQLQAALAKDAAEKEAARMGTVSAREIRCTSNRFVPCASLFGSGGTRVQQFKHVPRGAAGSQKGRKVKLPPTVTVVPPVVEYKVVVLSEKHAMKMLLEEQMARKRKRAIAEKEKADLRSDLRSQFVLDESKAERVARTETVTDRVMKVIKAGSIKVKSELRLK